MDRDHAKSPSKFSYGNEVITHFRRTFQLMCHFNDAGATSMTRRVAARKAVDNPVSCFAAKAARRFSDIEVLDRQGVTLDEVSARFYLVAHQCREDLVRAHDIFDIDA